jgi:hypothetical protein
MKLWTYINTIFASVGIYGIVDIETLITLSKVYAFSTIMHFMPCSKLIQGTFEHNHNFPPRPLFTPHVQF